MSKNPYEMRLDILKMAQEMHGEGAKAETIISTAEELYTFVNSNSRNMASVSSNEKSTRKGK